MTVNTNLFRHLSARWLIRESAANKIYCGVSKQLPSSFDESFNSTTTAISNSVFFTKLSARFIEQSDNTDYDVKLLTQQLYFTTNQIVDSHTFQDNIVYWKYISEERALELKSYNTIASFFLNNVDRTRYSDLQNIKTFYLFHNLTVNGEEPANDYFYKDQQDLIEAESVVLIEKLAYVYTNVDAGVCSRIDDGLTIPDNYRDKVNYFISF